MKSIQKQIADLDIAIENAPTDFAESVLKNSRAKLMEKVKVKKSKVTKYRWNHYQVEGERYVHPLSPLFPQGQTIDTKTVAELTEEEAKDELCLAMDLIAKITTSADDIIIEAKKHKYYPR